MLVSVQRGSRFPFRHHHHGYAARPNAKAAHRQSDAQRVARARHNRFYGRGVRRRFLSCKRRKLHASAGRQSCYGSDEEEGRDKDCSPGKLVTHQADLDGLDSRDLRHVEEFCELWSCCGRGPKDKGGCQVRPSAVAGKRFDSETTGGKGYVFTVKDTVSFADR